MADARHTWSDAELEQALADLGPRLAYPAAPDLARSVRARLAAPPHRRRLPATLPLRRGLALAALVVLALAGLVLVVSPAARSAVAERLGLRGVRIEYRSDTATPAATAAITPPPAGSGGPSPAGSSPGARLGLGERVTLDAARRRVPFAVPVPTLAELGDPDEVYVDGGPAGGMVSLVYQPRAALPEAAGSGAGLLVTVFRGDLNPGLIGKSVGRGTTLAQVTVNGARGFWLEGAPHVFLYMPPGGDIREERIRLAANVLLWERDGVTYRIESALGREAAVRIAESMR